MSVCESRRGHTSFQWRTRGEGGLGPPGAASPSSLCSWLSCLTLRSGDSDNGAECGVLAAASLPLNRKAFTLTHLEVSFRKETGFLFSLRPPCWQEPLHLASHCFLNWWKAWPPMPQKHRLSVECVMVTCFPQEEGALLAAGHRAPAGGCWCP